MVGTGVDHRWYLLSIYPKPIAIYCLKSQGHCLNKRDNTWYICNAFSHWKLNWHRDHVIGTSSWSSSSFITPAQWFNLHGCIFFLKFKNIMLFIIWDMIVNSIPQNRQWSLYEIPAIKGKVGQRDSTGQWNMIYCALCASDKAQLPFAR